MNKKVIAMLAAVLTAFSGCASNAATPEQITVSEVLSSLTETEAPVTEDDADIPEEVTDNIPDETEGVPETTAEETTAEETAETYADDGIDTPYESGVKNFLDALGSGQAGGEYIYTNYDFLKDIRLSDYSYKYIDSNDYSADYEVSLDVAESSNDYVPLGKSTWHLTVGDGVGGFISGFYPADRYPEGYDGNSVYNTFEEGSAMYEAANIAYNVSLLAGIFDTNDTPLEEWVPDEGSGHRFYHSVNLDFENGVTPEQLSEAVKKVYGLTLPVDKMNLKVDEEGLLPKDCAHGLMWTLYDIVDYSSNENEIMIELVFYGDEAKFYSVKQSKYYFDINEDNSVTLRSVEKVFDKGYDIVRLSV